MKAKDLRIGNITSAGVVNEILQDRFYVHDGESSLKSTWFDIKPIPLTEEWLLKFEEFSKTDKEGTPCFFNGDNIMLFDRGGCFDAYLHSEVDGSVFFATRLFHVHQLQNFYHAIEKQELTIKE
jgi:hypothetical protein